MNHPPIKIGISGTHSTGKSTFLAALASDLERSDLQVGRISDIARQAQDVGFPILSGHTFESTLWIMAECLRQEAEASLTCEVILVDRPAFDALGYLRAAAEVTDRTLHPKRLKELEFIARASASNFDQIIVTSLDHNLPIGVGRDQDAMFRNAAARHITTLTSEIAPSALQLTSTNSPEIVAGARDLVFSQLPDKRTIRS